MRCVLHYCLFIATRRYSTRNIPSQKPKSRSRPNVFSTRANSSASDPDSVKKRKKRQKHASPKVMMPARISSTEGEGYMMVNLIMLEFGP